MEHKDIFASKESFENWLGGKKDEHNWDRYGTFGDPQIDYDRVVDSLLVDGYIDPVDYRPIGEAKRVIDEAVAEVGDHFLIHEEGDAGDIYLHHVFNLYTYNHMVPPQFAETFAAFGDNPELLRAKLREKLTFKPREFIERSLAADWTDRETPVKVYVDKLCERLKFSYDTEPQRAGLTLVTCWLMGKLVELGNLELRDEEGEKVVYLASDWSANWILDEMLRDLRKPE